MQEHGVVLIRKSLKVWDLSCEMANLQQTPLLIKKRRQCHEILDREIMTNNLTVSCRWSHSLSSYLHNHLFHLIIFKFALLFTWLLSFVFFLMVVTKLMKNTCFWDILIPARACLSVSGQKARLINFYNFWIAMQVSSEHRSWEKIERSPQFIWECQSSCM
jgi:hypothetical protein